MRANAAIGCAGPPRTYGENVTWNQDKTDKKRDDLALCEQCFMLAVAVTGAYRRP